MVLLHFGLFVTALLQSVVESGTPPAMSKVYSCPPGFVHLQPGPLNDREPFKCYSFPDTNRNFIEADLKCRTMNARLATPSSVEETNAISEYVIKNLTLERRQFWIDVTKHLLNSNETLPYESPTAQPSTSSSSDSRVLERIIESISTTSSSSSSSTPSPLDSCFNMLVWVVGREDVRWVSELCDKKAHPLCQTDAKPTLQLDASINNTDSPPAGASHSNFPQTDDRMRQNFPFKEPTIDPNRECSLQCSSHTMRIACELRLFPEARNRTVALNDPTCLARDNRTHLIIHTALDDCGTQVENSVHDKVVYKNTLNVLYGYGVGMWSSLEIMKVACRYPQTNHISQSIGLQEGSSPAHRDGFELDDSSGESRSATVRDGSHFRHIFLIYERVDYDCPIQPHEYPYNFHPDDRIYTEIRVIVPSEQVELHPIECFVTQTKEITPQSVRHTMLRGGCVEDESFQFENSPSGKISRFSFNLDGIIRLFMEMYIRCEVILCAVNSAHSEECPYQCARTHQKRSLPLNRGPAPPDRNLTTITVDAAENKSKQASSSKSVIVYSNKIQIVDYPRTRSKDEARSPQDQPLPVETLPENPKIVAVTTTTATAAADTEATRSGADGNAEAETKKIKKNAENDEEVSKSNNDKKGKSGSGMTGQQQKQQRPSNPPAARTAGNGGARGPTTSVITAIILLFYHALLHL